MNCFYATYFNCQKIANKFNNGSQHTNDAFFGGIPGRQSCSKSKRGSKTTLSKKKKKVWNPKNYANLKSLLFRFFFRGKSIATLFEYSHEMSAKSV
jgi:hypothetical protein